MKKIFYVSIILLFPILPMTYSVSSESLKKVKVNQEQNLAREECLCGCYRKALQEFGLGNIPEEKRIPFLAKRHDCSVLRDKLCIPEQRAQELFDTVFEEYKLQQKS